VAPTPPSRQIRFAVADAYWHGLSAIGLTRSAVLHHARLLPQVGSNDRSQRRDVDTDEFFRLWDAMQALSPDENAGLLLATRLHTAMLPPPIFAAFLARDYRDALTRYARYKQVCAPENVTFVENGEAVAITIDWWQATRAVPHTLIDAGLATLVELGRRGTGKRIVPLSLELMRPADRGDSLARYFGCRVTYAAQRDALTLKATDLELAFLDHNPELLEMLSPGLAAALQAVEAEPTIRQQVVAVLKRILPSGRSDIGDVAKELAISERTLQRRIASEGTSFRDLLIDTRKHIATTLLSDPFIEIGEVAYMAGYGDINAFYRSFRKWMGTTPFKWRRERVHMGTDLALVRHVSPG
jgi:AraC-like DNA-binding protein